MEILSNNISDSLFGSTGNYGPFTAATIDTTGDATFGEAQGDETFDVEVVSVIVSEITAAVKNELNISVNSLIKAFLEVHTTSVV